MVLLLILLVRLVQYCYPKMSNKTLIFENMATFSSMMMLLSLTFGSIINYQDKANPLATVLSAAMLLKYGLGEEKAAQRIEAAVLDTLDRGYRTGDIHSPGQV